VAIFEAFFTPPVVSTKRPASRAGLSDAIYELTRMSDELPLRGLGCCLGCCVAFGPTVIIACLFGRWPPSLFSSSASRNPSFPERRRVILSVSGEEKAKRGTLIAALTKAYIDKESSSVYIAASLHRQSRRWREVSAQVPAQRYYYSARCESARSLSKSPSRRSLHSRPPCLRPSV
jgi:hypothetical protein